MEPPRGNCAFGHAGFSLGKFTEWRSIKASNAGCCQGKCHFVILVLRAKLTEKKKCPNRPNLGIVEEQIHHLLPDADVLDTIVVAVAILRGWPPRHQTPTNEPAPRAISTVLLPVSEPTDSGIKKRFDIESRL